MGQRTAALSPDRQHGSSVLPQTQSEHRSASTAVASSSQLPGKQASCPRPGPAVCILVSLQACACPFSRSPLPASGKKEPLSLSLCHSREGLPSTNSYHYLSKQPHCSGKTLPPDSCRFRPLCFRQQDWLYNQSEVDLFLFFLQLVSPEPSVI